MTLPEKLEYSLKTGGAGVDRKRRRRIKDEHTFPEGERAKTVTLPNRRCQRIHSQQLEGCAGSLFYTRGSAKIPSAKRSRKL
jgi:hypothetical protein